MSRRVIINGTLKPIPQPTEIDFDPVRGLVVTQEYKSAGANCNQLAAWAFRNKVQFKLRASTHISSIVLTYSGGQNQMPDLAQPHWEVLGNEIQKSIFESGIALSGAESFSSLLKDVRDGWAAIQSGDSATEQDLRDTLPGGELVYYDQLIGFLMRGQTHFAAGQYVAKLTTSISNFSNANVFIGNAEHIWSTESLLGLDQPSVISQIISSVGSGPTAHENYAWGWRQLPPRVGTGAQNRYEVSVEWWFEEWSTLLYGEPI